MSELREMGWNDVIGNLSRAADATIEEKMKFAEDTLANKIGLPRREAEYIAGVKEAARAFIESPESLDRLVYRGPEWVKEYMNEDTR